METLLIEEKNTVTVFTLSEGLLRMQLCYKHEKGLTPDSVWSANSPLTSLKDNSETLKRVNELSFGCGSSEYADIENAFIKALSNI